MSRSRSTTVVEQKQAVSQETTVNVQNIIEAQKLEPLERVKLLAEVFNTIDAGGREAGAGTVVVVQTPDPFAILKDPNFLIMAGSILAATFILVKKV